ncbi:hypothetical protein KAH43_01635 [Candidatus Bipolaricaulota bacterium]|nr:hypothetical protein [Candidatus Bipolaricaulota bacterium]
MKRNGLRALALASCVVALFSVLSMAVDLNGIVDNEFIEEISKAAGLNLVDLYIADYTVEELTVLAASGYTPGIKLAADRALFKIGGGLFTLIAMTDEELLALAVAGDLDAADAYIFSTRTGLKKVELVEAALAAATDDALIRAYGKLLGGFYGPGSPVGMKTEAELLVLVEGEDLGLRVAAATALTTYWILGSDLTIPQVEKAILGVTLWKPELAAAYQGFLAYLYSL